MKVGEYIKQVEGHNRDGKSTEFIEGNSLQARAAQKLAIIMLKFLFSVFNIKHQYCTRQDNTAKEDS